SDINNGVIDRFRSMPIVGSSVLVGHVVASVGANIVSTSIVIGVAILTGFRPNASLTDWITAAGFLVLFIVAISWVGVAIGLLVRSVEAASGATFFVLFLPHLSSAFVPTDGLPAVLKPFAEHQPYTPIIETIRALLLGTNMGNHGWTGLLYLVGLLGVSLVVSIRL